MKNRRTQLDTLILIFGSLFLAFTGQVGSRLYDMFTVPSPILTVSPITEQSIRDGVRQEMQAKRYQRATRLAAAVYRFHGCKATYAELTGKYAVEYGINPRILAALVYVESTCRAGAVSGRDSVGLTQVNPRVWKYSRKALLDPETNMKIGADILARYTKLYGLVKGLHAYNGFGDPSNDYSDKVLLVAGVTP